MNKSGQAERVSASHPVRLLDCARSDISVVFCIINSILKTANGIKNGLLFRSVVKQAGAAAVGSGGWLSAAVCHPQAKAFT